MVGLLKTGTRTITIMNSGPVYNGQVLSNSDFDTHTIGEETNADPGFDDAGEWSAQGNWSVAGSVATHTGGTSDSLTANTETTTTGHCYQVQAVVTVDAQDGQQRYASARWSNADLISDGTGTFTGYVAACGNVNPTKYTLRTAGSSSGTWTLSSASVKEVTLDDWTIVGTRSLAEYLIYNVTNNTLQLVSDGSNEIGISQALSEGAGKYWYDISIGTVSAGGVDIYDDVSGALVSFTSAQSVQGEINIQDTTIKLQTSSGGGNVIINYFKLYKLF